MRAGCIQYRTTVTKVLSLIMATLTAISGPLIGYSTLAPRPHGGQAVQPNVIPPPPTIITPPLAPTTTVELDYLLTHRQTDLRFLALGSKIVDIRYRDGTNV